MFDVNNTENQTSQNALACIGSKAFIQMDICQPVSRRTDKSAPVDGGRMTTHCTRNAHMQYKGTLGKYAVHAFVMHLAGLHDINDCRAKQSTIVMQNMLINKSYYFGINRQGKQQRLSKSIDSNARNNMCASNIECPHNGIAAADISVLLVHQHIYFFMLPAHTS